MPGGAEITLVEGDTDVDLLFALADAYAYFPLTSASSISFKMNGLSATLTPVAQVGYAQAAPIPSTFTATIGHFHGHVLVTMDGFDQYFPSEAPVFVEVLPHTRART